MSISGDEGKKEKGGEEEGECEGRREEADMLVKR